MGCTVQQVVYEDGSSCNDPTVDPVVGLPVTGADGRTAGKLVDLDPEQQMVSEIWGFEVIVGGKDNGLAIRGDFDVAAFAEFGSAARKARATNSFFGTFYQSLLQNVVLKNQAASRFVKELEQASPEGAAKRKTEHQVQRRRL